VSTHTPVSASAPDAPTRSHPVAGTAAWILGSIATALSTVFLAQVAHAVLVEWSAYEGGMATTALAVLGFEVIVLAVFWMLWLLPFLLLRREGRVTWPAVMSSVAVGVATGAVLFALLLKPSGRGRSGAPGR
jgi:hypothetical protein